MNLPTLTCAQALRDGGIDAVAALNEALNEALECVPPACQEEIKLHFGHVMATVLEETVNIAVRAFPELDPDEATWVAVAKSRAIVRVRSTT